MKPLGSYSIRSVIIHSWVFYAAVFFMFISLFLPFLFDVKYVEHVVQLIMWVINVLVFMFLISVTIKNNMEINKNKEVSISFFDYFLTIVLFFFIVVFVPVFGNFDRFVEVISSFVRVL
jgi:hypothetical protein